MPADFATREKYYNAIVALLPEVERKGKKNPYTSQNGYMVSFLNKEGDLGLRLSKADMEACMKEFDTGLIVSYNTVMKDFARVPGDVLPQTEMLAEWLRKAHAHTATLKPKPTKR